MPVPEKKQDESQTEFMSRCMSDSKMREEYGYEQRLAVCMSQASGELASGAVFIYEDPKTGELYHYSRKGIYRKSGRILQFVKKSKSATDYRE